MYYNIYYTYALFYINIKKVVLFFCILNKPIDRFKCYKLIKNSLSLSKDK